MDPAHAVGWFGLPKGISPSGLLRKLRRTGYASEPSDVVRYETVFVDTQDGRLWRNGYRFAIRRAGRNLWCRLEAPDGDSEGAFAGPWAFRSLFPAMTGLPGQVRELAAGRLLFPWLKLQVSAWHVRLQSPSGDRFELRGERFAAAAPRAPWSPGARHGLLRVRLIEGDPGAFLRLTTFLRERLELASESGDACAVGLRALGMPAPGAPIPEALVIRPDDPLNRPARKIAGQQLVKIRGNLQGAVEDLDPEFLHDLRVAIRRLRSALRLFSEILGPKRCAALRAELAWIGAHTGSVRDLDVFLAMLSQQIARLGAGEAIATLLADEVSRRRTQAHAALAEALASRRFRSLLRALERLASSPNPPSIRGARGTPIRIGAPRLIRKAQQRVLALGRTLTIDSPAADLHRLRILCKRLRYTCEFFREAFRGPSGVDPLGDYIKRMVRLQDCLGEHQDAIVAISRMEELVKDMAEHGWLMPDHLMDVGGMIQIQREIAADRRRRVAKLWARFDRGSLRKIPRTLGKDPRLDAAKETRPAT